jgi:DNA repair exonuclease SbcCD ATPase subunit
MIVFKKATAKNFLSYGNVPTTWELNKHASTLIIGKNGHGKSVLLDLVCFAVFGKPYRNVNKPQLINSINGKNCITELELTVDSVEYKIVRGMKPNIFEIYREGKMLDQDAAMRDMQEYLEQTILKLNYKTFCQVVILGSASFTPFMQLQAYQRREVVEDVLDIGIFSKMNSVLKDRIAGTKEELKVIEVKVDSAKKETVSQKKIIQLIQDNRNSRIAEINQEKEELVEELRLVLIDKDKLDALVSGVNYTEQTKIKDKFSTLSVEVSEHKSSIQQLLSKQNKLQKITECPTCQQGISDDHKHNIGIKTAQEQGELQQRIEELLPLIAELEKKIDDIEKLNLYINNEKQRIKNQVDSLNSKIENKEEHIERILNDSGDLEKEQEKLKSIASTALEYIKRRTELSEEKQLQEISQVLLKDNGIKTAIIKEYLPVLNKLINKYLQCFDFFVNFNLDESFSEQIKSRGRDEFSYANFSEGEKRKIDLAILLAFRQIAAMKNSAKVNLLLFDEIADSSFDLDARAKFNELLAEMSGSNVFVISHTDTSPDAYDAVMKVEKKGDFSQYAYV